jgi:hypothetical protein
MDVPFPQIDPPINEEGLVCRLLKAPVRLFPQLGTADPSKGLARGAAHKDVHLVVDGSMDAEFGKDRGGVFLSHVAGDMVGLLIAPLG